MIQVHTPNFGVGARRGWCLAYVDDAGGVEARVPPRTGTAKAAFYNEQGAKRIRGGDSPQGLWVVGFLDFTAGPFTVQGHVFFMKHNGGGRYEIRDSEVGAGARGPYGSLAELTAWFGAYKPRFIGWSTHCDGRQYVKERETMEKTNINTARIIAYAFLGTDGRDGRGNARNGQRDGDLNKYHVGNDLTNQWILNAFDSPEAETYRKKIDAVYAERDTLRGVKQKLTAEIEELKQKLAESGKDDEASKPVEPPVDDPVDLDVVINGEKFVKESK